MKANLLRRRAAMLASPLVLLAIAGCSAPRVIPASTPSQGPAPAPRPAQPTPSAPPAPKNWLDAPATPGDWTWHSEGTRTSARFAGNLVTISCNRDQRVVTIAQRLHSGGSKSAITFLTSYGNRTVNADSGSGASSTISASFPANDSFLDSIAFSRGRFAIQTPGEPVLYLPSWPEVSRVIEDCR